ncbi:NAD(+)--rifampin ADP-ribosyltransferase [Corynebacterium sp.]|uniref:NAD(+)--rifampin ADP-ribosyltransferase n=1 Tax=Corynebacterium sp. TaxID=1720 RepID=UPI003B3B0721
MTAPLDDGPFFHGTAVPLRPGDLLTAGHPSNYRPDVVMNHVYFTALPDGAGLAAELAVELRVERTGDVAEGDLGEQAVVPHVYEVEPTGSFENDPNVTDQKFPGNPTRSFRSAEPVRIVREVRDWTRLTPEALQGWRDRLISKKPEERGEILN